MQDSENPANIENFIRNQLGLPPSAKDVDLGILYDSLDVALPLRPDFVFKDDGQIFFIEVKNTRVTLDTIARMALLRELWQKKPDRQTVQLVLATKTLNTREELLARVLDIRILKLPWSIGTPAGQEYTSTKIRISSQKSWSIVTRLLKEKSTSIRQLALKEGVSYAWAHKVIENLREQNVVKKEGGYVTIADLKNLLNGVAWERPIKNLQLEEFSINYTGSHTAAQEITRTLKDQKIKFAFTSYTAAGLYTSYAVRQDAVYLYIEKETIDLFKENFGSKHESTIRAVIYSPDRDVFSDTREKESIVVTSPAQTLLDLAGLGYSAMDLTKVMADNYAEL
jgi:DNA-binding transcriptional regulator YhcF (GntR family)